MKSSRTSDRHLRAADGGGRRAESTAPVNVDGQTLVRLHTVLIGEGDAAEVDRLIVEVALLIQKARRNAESS